MECLGHYLIKLIWIRNTSFQPETFSTKKNPNINVNIKVITKVIHQTNTVFSSKQQINVYKLVVFQVSLNIFLTFFDIL